MVSVPKDRTMSLRISHFYRGDLVTYSCHKSCSCQDSSCILSCALSERLEAFHVAHNLGCGAAAIWVRMDGVSLDRVG